MLKHRKRWGFHRPYREVILLLLYSLFLLTPLRAQDTLAWFRFNSNLLDEYSRSYCIPTAPYSYTGTPPNYEIRTTSNGGKFIFKVPVYGYKNLTVNWKARYSGSGATNNKWIIYLNTGQSNDTVFNTAISPSLVSYSSNIPSTFATINDTIELVYEAVIPTSSGYVNLANLFITGECGVPIINSTQPSSGPISTWVNLHGSLFSSVNAVTVDHIPALFEILSDTLMRLQIPAGASAGKIRILGPCWAEMAGNFQITNPSDCNSIATDLIISEIIEGNSNNKAIEIYNGTTDTISLANYSIKVYYN
ncbi:MAG: hypothetical protein KA053_09800, partial [Lentimicrobiaceae bacterium]|nr:hypothetical protein [Lentimicrobiaceae bacterium]